jgi:hypothetical protein
MGQHEVWKIGRWLTLLLCLEECVTYMTGRGSEWLQEDDVSVRWTARYTQKGARTDN